MFFVWGFHHLAKRNVQLEAARCEHCRRVVQLKSFDAHKFLHVYFVPLIPLGRKHVRDLCVGCERHYEWPAKKWEEDKSRILGEVESVFARDPLQLQASLDALNAFTFCGERARAAQIADHLEKNFAFSLDARAALLSWHSRMGQVDRATAFAAPEGAPGVTDDDAQRALSAAAIASGNQMLGAQHLLKVRAPDFDRDYLNLVRLATFIRAPGQEKEAYALYAYLFQHFPKQAATNTQCVKRTAALERKLGVRTSILPAGAHSRKDLWIGVGVCATIALVALLIHVGVTQFQPFFLLNETSHAATITIDGTDVTVKPGEVIERTISEGKHSVNVKLANGHRYDREIVVSNSFENRLKMKNAFVFNVLGTAALSHDEIIFEARRDFKRAEPRRDLLAGRDFYAFHDVDYAFESPPQSVPLDKYEKERVMHGLFKVEVAPAKVLSALLRKEAELPHVNPRGYAEGHLLAGAREEELVATYLMFCEDSCATESQELVRKLGIATRDAP